MTAVFRFSLVLVIAVGLFVVSGLAQVSSPAPSAQAALRVAIDAEVIRGDAEEAVRLYRRVVDQYGTTDRAVAAQALTRLGALHEKRDEIAQARAVYGRVVADFADHPPSRLMAQERLAQLPASQGAFASLDLTRQMAALSGATIGALSADGRYVALGFPQGSGGPPAPALVGRDLETGTEVVVATQLPGFSPHWPSFSPNGQFIGAWLQVGPRGPEPWGYSLVVARFAPRMKPLVIPAFHGTDMGLVSTWLQGVKWSPDSRFVPFVAQADRPGVFNVRLLDVQAGTHRPLGIDVTDAPDFVWSPTGEQLAVRVATAGGLEVRIVTVATGEIRVVPVPAPADGHQVRVNAWTTSGEFVLRRGPAPRDAIVETQLLNIQSGEERTTCRGVTGHVVGFVFRPNADNVCHGVSADGGRQLWWDAAVRRLMVRDTRTNADTPLTTAAGDEHHGQLSPDGRIALFVSNRGGSWVLYAAPLDQAPVARPVPIQAIGALPNGLEFSWYRDGFISRTATTESNIYRVPMDPATGRSTGGLERLTHDRPDNWFASVSPDGSSIAYLSQQNARLGLSLMDATGANERVVFDRFRIGLVSAEWRSADELLLLGTIPTSQPRGPRPLHAFDLRTGALREIATIPPQLERVTYPFYVYGRATDEAIFAVAGEDGRIALRARRLADGQERTLASFERGLFDYRLSPDGKRLAYTLNTVPRGNCRPCEMGIVTIETGERRLLPPPNQLPLFAQNWSPDGRFLLYGSWRPRVMDTLTGESWQLVDESRHPLPEGVDLTSWGEDPDGSWSPDGRFVAIGAGGGRTEHRRWSGVSAEAVAKLSSGK